MEKESRDGLAAKGLFINTVEPPLSDHPKSQAFVIAYGRWSLTRDYIITQVILAFWLVVAYGLLEERCTIDVIFYAYKV